MTLDLLGLANKYDFSPLQQSIMSYLKATLSVSNVCVIYNVAMFYQLRELCHACTAFVDMNATAVMKTEGFLSLSQQALTELVSRDSFFSPELDIYHGVKRWLEANDVSLSEAKDLLKVVRLQLLPLKDILGDVRQSELYDANVILDAITMMKMEAPIELRQRGLLCKYTIWILLGYYIGHYWILSRYLIGIIFL